MLPSVEQRDETGVPYEDSFFMPKVIQLNGQFPTVYVKDL
jgi:hypothetical protein